MSGKVTVIGAGLAGCEAAFRLAENGFDVRLVEMRPAKTTGAHKTGLFAELVCSNSFKSKDALSPPGELKVELSLWGSLVMTAAIKTAVPAGQALAVDRELFAKFITEKIRSHKNIRCETKEETSLETDELTIIATGPLTSEKLAEEVSRLTGRENLYFYDAISPIVDAESIDMGNAFSASRYGRGGDDYINCPMNRDEYDAFRNALLAAEKVKLHPFEEERYFEGCLPLEVIAGRGEESLVFGPFKPVGLTAPDKSGGEKPFCVVQLRPENRDKSAYSLVACQTRLTYPEQKRVFRLIPALRNARFLRYGSIHRNSYINSPVLLGGALELRGRENLRFAGQLTGVEGYLESVAMGVWSAEALIQARREGRVIPPPKESAVGALLNYVLNGNPDKPYFEPMNVNLSIFPPPEKGSPKKDRKKALIERAESRFKHWLTETAK
ncbi:MAG: FADH(2)-oxidizing methylenetetrahydrofolate--tRNA-(uracil(54)-C(5))-methyltra nsferase TrmFO [Myxococcota bacterium]